MTSDYLQNVSTRLDCAQASILLVRSYYLREPTSPAVDQELGLLGCMLTAASELGAYLTMLVDGFSDDTKRLQEIFELCDLAETLERGMWAMGLIKQNPAQ